MGDPAGSPLFFVQKAPSCLNRYPACEKHRFFGLCNIHTAGNTGKCGKIAPAHCKPPAKVVI